MILSRRVFSAQNGSRKVFFMSEPSLNGLSGNVFKILYDVCGLNGNVKHPIIQFSENDNIFFHLAAMSQCEKGGEGSYMGLSS